MLGRLYCLETVVPYFVSGHRACSRTLNKYEPQTCLLYLSRCCQKYILVYHLADIRHLYYNMAAILLPLSEQTLNQNQAPPNTTHQQEWLQCIVVLIGLFDHEWKMIVSVSTKDRSHIFVVVRGFFWSIVKEVLFLLFCFFFCGFCQSTPGRIFRDLIFVYPTHN